MGDGVFYLGSGDMDEMCLNLLGSSSITLCSNKSYKITSHVHGKRFDANEILYLRSSRNHLLYCAHIAPAEYLTKIHLTKLLRDTANKNPDEWEREFSILWASKGSFKSSQELEVEKVKISPKIDNVRDLIFDFK